MRLSVLRISKSLFLGWRIFNLPTKREERILRRAKKALDTAADLVWKTLAVLAMMFELKRRRENPGRRRAGRIDLR